MSPQLHHLHCETCKNMDCIRHGIHNLYPRECDLVTEAVGCASHSTANDKQTHPETQKEFNRITIGAMGEFIKENKELKEQLLNELIDIDKFIARHVGGKYIEIGEIRQYIHKKIEENKQED